MRSSRCGRRSRGRDEQTLLCGVCECGPPGAAASTQLRSQALARAGLRFTAPSAGGDDKSGLYSGLQIQNWHVGSLTPHQAGTDV